MDSDGGLESGACWFLQAGCLKEDHYISSSEMSLIDNLARLVLSFVD
jgi:hypothetical protein